jgi:CHAT domain
VLVIGEPECPPDEYPRLPGARNEAIAVRDCLAGGLDPVQVCGLISADPSVVGADARTVVNKLFEKPWRIVHISGHGKPSDKPGESGGVVLSNGSFLGVNEIKSMRVVPELVFVNCCFLASSGFAKLFKPYDRATFASGVADALIRIGVKCVVAAGWAVDDEAASVFAQTFYDSLLNSKPFVDAVSDARRAAYDANPDVNTWAAYQCYGDPDWVFRRKETDANAYTPSREDPKTIASPGALRLALQRILVETKFQGASTTAQLDSLRDLEKAFGGKWGKFGEVAEAFGEAFLEAGGTESAVTWYRRAVEATDGRASMKSAEQLANAKARLGWELVDEAKRHLDDMKQRERAVGRRGKARTAARRARQDGERSLREAVGRADRLIAEAHTLLQKLLAVEATMERHSLVGSAYKRQALVDAAAGRGRAVAANIRKMRESYRDALDIGSKSGDTDLFYPSSNCLIADVVLAAKKGRARGLDAKMYKIAAQSLETKAGHDATFWSVAGKTELDQYQAIAKGKLAGKLPALKRGYDDLRKRVTAPRKWASVYDTACLVFPSYLARARSAREKQAAEALLRMLRGFAHPDESAA